MADRCFKAKVPANLSKSAQSLADLYDQQLGSSGPYCNPRGLAAVIRAAVNQVMPDPVMIDDCCDVRRAALLAIADQLDCVIEDDK